MTEARQFEVEIGRTYEDRNVYWSPFIEKNPHIIVVGETGTGKTQTMKSIMYETKKKGVSHIVLDYHDDYIDQADRVIDVRKGISINPLETSDQYIVDTSYQVSEGLKRFGLVGGDQQQAYLRKAILRSFGIDEDRSMKRILPISQPGVPTFKDVKHTLRVLETTDSHAKKIIPALMNRMGIIFDLELFSKETQIPFGEITKGTTVISLKSLPTDQVRLVVADFFLKKFWDFVYMWGQSDSLRLLCVLDEAHRLAYRKSPVDSMLREARKYGVGMLLASQSPGDFSDIVFANAAVNICFRCPLDRDAQFMAKHMGPQPSEIQNLSQEFEAFFKTGTVDGVERIQINPYFRRVSTEEEKVKKKENEASSGSRSDLGGQVTFGERGLSGNASLGKWTDKKKKD